MPATPAESALEAQALVYAYGAGPAVLDIPELHLARGEQVFVRGPSGSGKSTLLGLIAGVLEIQSGSLSVLGQDMARLKTSGRDGLRARDLGVIFQMFNLVPYLSVIENVTLPLQFSQERRARISGPIKDEARRLLAQLGLTDSSLISRRVGALSTGQQQRVAAARALIGAPSLILADEPTSALDADARALFINLLSAETKRSGAALMFVSHDASLAPLFDRTLDLSTLNRASLPA